MAMSKDNADPLQINARLYRQVSRLLDDLEAPPVKKGRGKDAEEVEKVTVRERIAALTAIARIQQAFIVLRAEESGNERKSGSAVRKYASAFKDAGGRRAKGGGSAAAAAPEPVDFGPDDDDGDAA
jgi:hypothetical protein